MSLYSDTSVKKNLLYLPCKVCVFCNMRALQLLGARTL